MRILDRLSLRVAPANVSITDWSKMFRPGATVAYNGNTYQGYRINSGTETPAAGYYDSNAVVFACATNRMLLFAEARFQFQQLRKGRPGDLFGTPALDVLQEPWQGATTRDLLAQAELDILCAGNSYWIRDGNYLLRLDPAKVKLLTERATETQIYGQTVGERLLAYVYVYDPKDPSTWTTYPPEDVTHYKPHPDKNNRFIGMSWLSPCIADIEADVQFSEHKTSSVGNGAQLGYVVSLDKDVSPEQFKTFVKEFEAAHNGPQNAGKTLFLGGGADVKTVGQTFENLALRATQGAGETRIAACAGVPPVIVGLSEGLASATYSNYGQARRRLVDGTMRPLWGAFAGSMSSLVPPPDAARLWYDDRDIPFLREDVTDQQAILKEQMLAIEAGVRAGFEPDTVVDAVVSGDPSRMVHGGLFSVQLQPPMSGEGTANEPPPMPVPSNGNGNGQRNNDRPLQLFVSTPEIRMPEVRAPDVYVNVPELLPTPVTVTAPDVYVAAPEVRVEVPEQHQPDVYVQVEAPDVHIAPEFTVETPDVRVNVEAPNVTVAAPNVEVQPPEVNIQPADVRVNVEAPSVQVEAPEVTVQPADVRVNVEAPSVNVESPDVVVQPPEVRVNVESPQITVEGPPARKVRRTIERDERGLPIGIIEEDVDDESDD